MQIVMQMNPEWLFPVSDSHAYMDAALLDGRPTSQRQNQDTKAEIRVKTIPKYLEFFFLSIYLFFTNPAKYFGCVGLGGQD